MMLTSGYIGTAVPGTSGAHNCYPCASTGCGMNHCPLCTPCPPRQFYGTFINVVPQFLQPCPRCGKCPTCGK